MQEKKAGKIPGLLTDTLSGLAKGKTKVNIELTGIDEPLEKTGNYIKYVVLAIIACVLFVGSCILAGIDIEPKTSSGMPLFAVIGIVFSIVLSIFSVGKMSKK